MLNTKLKKLRVFLFTLSLYGCSDASSDYDGPAGNGTSAQLLPTYSQGIKTVISENCVGCHSKYSTLAGVKAEYSQIMASINNSRMPQPNPSSMSAKHKELLTSWGSASNEPYGQFAE